MLIKSKNLTGRQGDEILPVQAGFPGAQDLDPVGVVVRGWRCSPLLPPALRQAEPHLHRPIQGPLRPGD